VSRASYERLRPVIELTVGYSLILLVIWTPNPIQRVFFWTAFAWIVVTTLALRRAEDELGFGIRRARRAFWIAAAVLATCLVVIGIAEVFGFLHPLFGPKPLPVHLWGYLLWALFQQFALQDFVLLRLLRITGHPMSAVLSAGFLFAVAHLPNPVLTVATLLWGITACFIFLRYRSLYVLAIAHWMLGLCIAVTAPNAINHHMRVGLGYVRYGTPKDSNLAAPALPNTPGAQSGIGGTQ